MPSARRSSFARASLPAFAFALALLPRTAAAATEAATKGAPALAVAVDLSAGVVRYRTCSATPCAVDASSATLPIALDRARFPDARDVVVDVVPLAPGRDVVHVRVPSRDAGASRRARGWEALLAPGAAAPIFAGATGLTAGDEGERTGTVVEITPRDATTKSAIVGEIREDLRLCGQEATLLAPRALDPASFTLRSATMHRLPAAQREGARRVVASARKGLPDPPLAPLLVATGGSGPGFAALADGKTSTAWSETRPGDGRGEFVVFRAPEEIPIARLALVIAPDAPARDGSAPRTLFLVTESATVAVTLPEDAWKHPGASYDVPLVDPLRSSCLAMVLDEAYARGETPAVTIAEVIAYSELDAPGAKLEAVAAVLNGGGPRALAAAGVLKRAGAPAFAAAAAAYAGLDAAGRALAIDAAASSAACDAAAPLFVRGAGDADAEVARKARGSLERCGKAAAPALAAAVRGSDMAARAGAAPLLATLAPREALGVLAGVLGEGPPETRAAVRGALAAAARRADREAVGALLRAPASTRSSDVDLELLRALRAELPTFRPEANALAARLLDGAPAPAMRVRYLALEPLATLARAGDRDAAARFAALLAKDADGPVRARAAELAGGLTEAPLEGAIADREPRVRAAALRAAADSRDARAATGARAQLAADAWTFVRVAAAGTLAVMPPAAATDDAIVGALGDKAPSVREAAAYALGSRRVAAAAPALEARMNDAHEELDVRVAAARALGAMCSAASLDKLTAAARAAASPVAGEVETQLGLAALAALGAIHPPDLAKRLAPLVAKDARAEVQRLAQAALRGGGVCRK